jgi:hypothetical protein
VSATSLPDEAQSLSSEGQSLINLMTASGTKRTKRSGLTKSFIDPERTSLDLAILS